jgi:hypothetical protein
MSDDEHVATHISEIITYTYALVICFFAELTPRLGDFIGDFLLLDIFYPETKLKTIQNSKISRGTHVERMTADTFTIADVAPVSQIFGA